MYKRQAFDTPEELDAKRKEIDNFQYDAHTRTQMRNSLTMSKEECDQRIADGEQFVVRFKIEPGVEVHVQDMIRGDVIVKSCLLYTSKIEKINRQTPCKNGLIVTNQSSFLAETWT